MQNQCIIIEYLFSSVFLVIRSLLDLILRNGYHLQRFVRISKQLNTRKTSKTMFSKGFSSMQVLLLVKNCFSSNDFLVWNTSKTMIYKDFSSNSHLF